MASASPYGDEGNGIALAQLGDAFVSRTANVNGTTLHYVRGGSGPSVILLHGFPQDWSVFRRIMPRLARAFTGLAVDLRGIGGSTPTPDRYDAAALAEDVHQLPQHLALEKPYIAGHDNGAWSPFRWLASIRRRRAG